MTDTEARDALAKALHEWRKVYVDPSDPDRWHEDSADVILAALDGWTLVPVARLREVEQERDNLDDRLDRQLDVLNRYRRERDAARADADRLAEALREAIEALEFDGQGYEEGRVVLAAHEAAK